MKKIIITAVKVTLLISALSFAISMSHQIYVSQEIKAENIIADSEHTFNTLDQIVGN